MTAQQQLNTLEPEILDPADPAPPLPSTVEVPASPGKEDEDIRGGKIAHLPKVLRDQVNTMLDDGVPYRLIIKKLNESTEPPLPWAISEVNICRWKKNGYQKYLLHQDLRADIRFIRESAADFSGLNGEHEFQNTLIQLGLTDVYRSLTDPRTRTDPLNHIRILNALARLNREALSLRKYNDLRADEAATQPTGPTRAPTAEEICNSFLVGFETVHGIKPADAPIGPDLNDYPCREPQPIPSPRGEGQGEGECASSSSSSSSSSVAAPKSDEGGSSPSKDRTQDIPSPGARPTFGGEARPVLRSAFPPCIGLAKESDEGRDEGELIKSPTESPPQSKIENQNSKIEPSTPPPPQPPELCYSCSVPLPPLRPDGTRPSRSCPGCNIRLYPPDTTFDHCPICEAFQAILPGGERNSSACERCHQTLPPPGQRYLAQCPGCGIQLKNFDMHGNCIVERCRNCLTPLPLLEPIPDSNQNSKIENQKSDEPPPLAAAA